ncbi:MAG: tetratricopeptide repeat protein, partial [Chloroflexi bacterium]|nr:tetratricopeptide repeat protein [Chloroflexota bacterium]
HGAAVRTLDAIAEPDAEDTAEAILSSAWAGDASLEQRCAKARAEDLAEDARCAEAIAALMAGDNDAAAMPRGDEDDVFPGEHWRAEALDALGRDREAQAARRACATGIALDSDEFALQLDCALALDGPEAAKRLSEQRAFVGLVPLRPIGRIALRLGDVREAEAAVRHLLEQSPRDVETLLLASEWQAGRGDLASALGHLDDALTVQPRRHRLRFARAELLRQLHRADEAQRALEELTRESPGSWRYHVALAELLDERGGVVQARDEWRAAHRVAPDVPAVARAIGRLEGEDRAFARSREEAERSVRTQLGATADALGADARAAAVGAEQDWRSLGTADDHSTVVTQLAKAVEIELMRRVFDPFRARGSPLVDARRDVGGFGKWCAGQIASLSLGEMAFALGALAREERSPLLEAFNAHAYALSAAPWDLNERLALPLRTLAARRNAAVHKDPVSRAEAEDSRRSVLGREDREGLLGTIVARFPLPGAA